MKTPDELVVGIERSIFGRALILSVIVHILLIGVTSVSLYRDWATYGVHSPSYINSVKSQQTREAEETRRKVAAEAKAAEEAAKAEQMKAIAATNGTAKATGAASGKSVDVDSDKRTKSVTPPEVKPLPPKKEFEYGEDLSLD